MRPWGWAPVQSACVLIGRGNSGAHRNNRYDTCMEQKPHENPVRKQPPASLRIEPADTLILDFQPPEFWISIILATQSVALCSGSPSKLIQTLSDILGNLEMTETKMDSDYLWVRELRATPTPFLYFMIKNKTKPRLWYLIKKTLRNHVNQSALALCFAWNAPPGKSHWSCSIPFSRPSVTWHLIEVRTEDFLRGNLT